MLGMRVLDLGPRALRRRDSGPPPHAAGHRVLGVFGSAISMLRRQRICGALASAAMMLVALSSVSPADAAPVAATLGAGSDPMALVSSTALPNGDVKTRWVGHSGATAVAVAAPGSVLTVHGDTATLSPPQAAGVPTGGTGLASSKTSTSTGVSPADTWVHPALHSYFNALDLTYCVGGDCVYGSSVQYALQQIPGEYYYYQKTTGTVYPGSGGAACYGKVYTEFPGETGDSGPLAYSPNSSTTQSAGSYTVGFSELGLSVSFTVSRTAGVFGPADPHGWNLPAFGSKWNGVNYGGCRQADEGLGSQDMIHLGTDQDPWDTMVVVAGN